MIVKAGTLKQGMQIAESDGFLFDVAEVIKETEESITVHLCSDFRQSTNIGMIMAAF